MGIERVVRLPSDAVPEWPSVALRLAEVGERPALRMIDNLPAFPDEAPPPGWRELRIVLAGGMVTIRRDSSSVRCIIWGTSDPRLARSRDACCWALAVAAGGVIEVATGKMRAADEFRAEFLSPDG